MAQILLQVCATPSGYVVSFYPFISKGATHQHIGVGGSVVANLADKLPQDGQNCYHVVMDNFFTNYSLLKVNYEFLRYSLPVCIEMPRIICARCHRLRKMLTDKRNLCGVIVDYVIRII